MNVTVYQAKLLALQKSVKGALDLELLHYQLSHVNSLFERYVSTRDALISSMPWLFGDISADKWPRVVHNPQNFVEYSGYDDFDYVEVVELEMLQNEISYCLDILNNQNLSEVSPQLALTNEGIFFAGQTFDAYRLIREILSAATKSIDLIDGYISEAVLDMLTGKKEEVTVRIVTKKVNASMQTAILAFNRQFKNLSLRTSSEFHDRFLIIDERDYYHFGASLKDAGLRGFMFSKIEEPAVVQALQTALKKIWQ